MKPVLSVAATAFRESIRNKTMLAIVLLAVGFIVSALLLAELALDQRTRVILDWGLFCVSAFGVLLSILIGVSQVHKEIRRKNLYVILTKPIYRWQYIFGKYMGLAATLLVELSVLSVALIILLAAEGITPSELLAQALLLALLEILLVAAIAVFFSSFSSPYLSGVFTFAIFVVGRSLPVLEKLADKTHNAIGYAVLKVLVWGLADLSQFNKSTYVVHTMPIGWDYVGLCFLYALGYTAVLLLLSSLIFSRRDIT